MADSDTTQQVTSKTPDTSEAQTKLLLAEVRAIIAKGGWLSLQLTLHRRQKSAPTTSSQKRWPIFLASFRATVCLQLPKRWQNMSIQMAIQLTK